MKVEKSILMISFYSYPMNAGGVVRINSLIDYLSSKHVKLYLLTVKPKYYPDFSIDTHENKKWDKINIIRTKVFMPSSKKIIDNVYSTKNAKWKSVLKKVLKNIILPDKEILWFPYLLVELIIFRIKKLKIDSIFVSSPPASHLLFGYYASRILKSKLFIDIRDDLFGNDNVHLANSVNKMFLKHIEKKTFQHSEKVFLVTEESKELYKKRYPELFAKLILAPNGFVEEKFKGKLIKGNNVDYPLKFVYFGSLNNYRTPYYVLKAIEKLNENFQLNQKLQIHFFGHFTGQSVSILNEYKSRYPEIIFVNSYLKNEEYFSTLENFADVLLVFQSPLDGGKTAVPGKVYEYFRTCKHIFVMSVEGATVNICKSYFNKTIVPYSNIEEIQKSINTVLNNLHLINRYPDENDINFINRFNRKFIYNNIFQFLILD